MWKIVVADEVYKGKSTIRVILTYFNIVTNMNFK